MDRQAKNHFDAVVKSLDINARRASGPLGTVEDPDAYNLSVALIDLARGIYYALVDLDSRLEHLEEAILSAKSGTPVQSSKTRR